MNPIADVIDRKPRKNDLGIVFCNCNYTNIKLGLSQRVIVNNNALRKGSERLSLNTFTICYELICMGVGATCTLLRHKQFGFIWYRAIYRMMREISGHILECIVL